MPALSVQPPGVELRRCQRIGYEPKMSTYTHSAREDEKQVRYDMDEQGHLYSMAQIEKALAKGRCFQQILNPYSTPQPDVQLPGQLLAFENMMQETPANGGYGWSAALMREIKGSISMKHAQVGAMNAARILVENEQAQNNAKDILYGAMMNGGTTGRAMLEECETGGENQELDAKQIYEIMRDYHGVASLENAQKYEAAFRDLKYSTFMTSDKDVQMYIAELTRLATLARKNGATHLTTKFVQSYIIAAIPVLKTARAAIKTKLEAAGNNGIAPATIRSAYREAAQQEEQDQRNAAPVPAQQAAQVTEEKSNEDIEQLRSVQEENRRLRAQLRRATQQQRRRGNNNNNGAPAVCHNFRDTGSCRFGDRCRFSHEVAGAGGEANPRT